MTATQLFSFHLQPFSSMLFWVNLAFFSLLASIPEMIVSMIIIVATCSGIFTKWLFIHCSVIESEFRNPRDQKSQRSQRKTPSARVRTKAKQILYRVWELNLGCIGGWQASTLTTVTLLLPSTPHPPPPLQKKKYSKKLEIICVFSVKPLNDVHLF